jgi:hypothetical protein
LAGAAFFAGAFFAAAFFAVAISISLIKLLQNTGLLEIQLGDPPLRAAPVTV